MRFHLMMRLLAIVVSVASIALVGALGTAGMATAQTPSKTVSMTGTDQSGRTVFKGTFTATGPVKENAGNSERPLLVTGQLKGQLDPSGGQAQRQGRGPVRPVDQQVDMPAAAAFTQGATTPAAGESLGQGVCNVLNLTLGPLDLNLLGLRVQLNQVVLNITAIPGGGLLGDLLCGLAGGPVPPIPTGLQQIINLLTQILGALGA